MVMAEAEFERLKDTSGWAPQAPIRGKLPYHGGVRYTFEDDSRLYINFDGSASCEAHASYVLRREALWHSIKG